MSLSELEKVSRHHTKLRAQRDKLIQTATESYRVIGKAAGLSPEAVRLIKQKGKEQT